MRSQSFMRPLKLVHKICREATWLFWGQITTTFLSCMQAAPHRQLKSAEELIPHMCISRTSSYID